MIETAYLLAGGRSRRFGRDKRLVTIGGEPLYHRQAAALKRIFRHAAILCKREDASLLADAGIPLVCEDDPNSSLLRGIVTGLKHAKGRSAFFLAVDMPKVPDEALIFFRDFPKTSRPVIPVIRGRIHAGCAIYPAPILPVLERELAARRFRMAGLLALVNPFYLYERDLPFYERFPDAFFNLNRPEDLSDLGARRNG